MPRAALDHRQGAFHYLLRSLRRRPPPSSADIAIMLISSTPLPAIGQALIFHAYMSTAALAQCRVFDNSREASRQLRRFRSRVASAYIHGQRFPSKLRASFRLGLSSPSLPLMPRHFTDRPAASSWAHFDIRCRGFFLERCWLRRHTKCARRHASKPFSILLPN